MKKLVVLAICLASLPVFAEPLHKQPVRYHNLEMDPERTTVLMGRVEDASVGYAEKDLKAFDKKAKKPIYLVINSPGGDMTSGFHLTRVMQELRSPLVCVVDEKAYSMAAIIAAYCPKLYVQENAMIMFHDATYSFKGKIKDMEQVLTIIKKELTMCFRNVAKRLGLTYEEYMAKIEGDKEWWMASDEAVSSGFASALVVSVKYDLPKRSIDFSIFF
jgi:ATP-dependent Clp protease protease subunit